ncbi:MAG: hypothetical protein HND27_07175 [Bacteroidetes bacterium]|nr:hypothetical protein [Bacteroidota bacterium]NOG95547.1 hypothetical protein [Bacteroidota bacterium]GIK70143.1 MAG: hypothetical protein BroJett020_14380 [Bacteroidota bacterium]
MKTQIIIVFDEQKEKSTGRFVVFKNGQLMERLEFENIVGGNLIITETAGAFSEALKEQFIKQ